MTPFIGFLLVASSVVSSTPAPELAIGQKIIQTAIAYGIDPVMSVEVAKCESGFRTDVFGDAGKAYGVFQFHRPTFDRFAREAGVKLDYKNPDHQVELYVWAIREGYASHWTCHRKLTKQYS